MEYHQNSILKEDFIRLPGGKISTIYTIIFKDDNIVRKHYNLKKLMKLKIEGFVVDTSSERALKKRRAGIRKDTFSLIENKGKFEDKEELEVEKVTKKKAPAKKSQKGGQEEEIEQKEGYSKELETFKTPRQNTLYSTFLKAFKEYRSQFKK